MKTKHILIVLLVGVIALVAMNMTKNNNSANREIEEPVAIPNHKDATYLIDGKEIKLDQGYSEISIPESSAKIVTRYFGNELLTDLNGDGREDVVFLLTQQTGGSGTFYYAVGALNTENGYVGSDGYLLGDRIAPQTIDDSPNPRHKNVIVVNYADRSAGEPMTTRPSIGKSVYLKLGQDNRWGIVMADFEGESR